MAYFNVTGDWLRQKISEMNRVVRNYAGATDVSTYWTSVTEKIQDRQEAMGLIRNRIQRIQAYLADLETDLDAKI